MFLHAPPPTPLLCRQYPAVLQFSLFLLAYLVLLLLALAEEFSRAPWALQQACCWIHENNSARNLLTLAAIAIHLGLASFDMVVRECGVLVGLPHKCWNLVCKDVIREFSI